MACAAAAPVFRAVSAARGGVAAQVLQRWASSSSSPPTSVDIVRIGRCERPQSHDEPYGAGAFFLHKRLGYIGVVVFSWRPKVWHLEPLPKATWKLSQSDWQTPHDSWAFLGDSDDMDDSSVAAGVADGAKGRGLAEGGSEETGKGSGGGSSGSSSDSARSGDDRHGAQGPRPIMMVPKQFRERLELLSDAQGGGGIGMRTGTYAAGAALEMRHHGARLVDEPYYQVLCDVTDTAGEGLLPERLRAATKSFVHYRGQSGDVDGETALGVDYVGHDDMVPITPTSEAVDRFANEWQKKLFAERTATKLSWGRTRERAHAHGLEHSAPRGADEQVDLSFYRTWVDACTFGLLASSVYVHRCPDTDIEIRVTPFNGSKTTPHYLSSAEDRSKGWRSKYSVTELEEPGTKHRAWCYKTMVHSHGDSPVTLRHMQWVVRDGGGRVHRVTGRSPPSTVMLKPRALTFQFSRFVTLPTRAGWLGGHLEFELSDGSSVDVPLPTIDLLPLPDSVDLGAQGR